MAPIVTLLTDFGTADSYVAEMKAILLSRDPAVIIVDVSHSIALGDVRSAAYLLGRSWHHFPPGTTHLCVVDPGVGTSRRALAVAAADHFFVGPDNGVLTPALDAEEPVEIVALSVPMGAAPTFHGRDLFAPAAARIAEGESLEYLGESAIKPVRIEFPKVSRKGNTVRGEVIYVDRFGTLVTNIDGSLLGSARSVCLPGTVVIPLARTFGDVTSGDAVAFLGSGGAVEIAVRDGRADTVLGLGIGTKVVLRG